MQGTATTSFSVSRFFLIGVMFVLDVLLSFRIYRSTAPIPCLPILCISHFFFFVSSLARRGRPGDAAPRPGSGVAPHTPPPAPRPDGGVAPHTPSPAPGAVQPSPDRTAMAPPTPAIGPNWINKRRVDAFLPSAASHWGGGRRPHGKASLHRTAGAWRCGSAEATTEGWDRPPRVGCPEQ